MHEYQLVIQFRGDSLEELDAAVEMEEQLGRQAVPVVVGVRSPYHPV
jgi:hypothetical protein